MTKYSQKPVLKKEVLISLLRSVSVPLHQKFNACIGLNYATESLKAC